MIQSVDREEMETIIPHRRIAFPENLTVYIDSENPDEVKAEKKIKSHDPCFQGHFPGNPIFPGHWLLEHFAIVCAISVAKKFKGLPGLAGADFSIKNVVKPGDTLTFEAKLERIRKETFFTFSGRCTNQNGAVVAVFRKLNGVSV